MLLRIVAELETVSGHDLTGIGFVESGEQTQQSRLAGAVVAEHDDSCALVDREVDTREHLGGTEAAREPFGGQRYATAVGWGREAQVRDLLRGAFVLESGEQSIGSFGHLLRGDGLRRLRHHLVRLSVERRGLLLCVGTFPAATPFIVLTLFEVEPVTHRIDVDGLPGGIEEEDLVDHFVDEVEVVADDDQATGVGLEVITQPQH